MFIFVGYQFGSPIALFNLCFGAPERFWRILAGFYHAIYIPILFYSCILRGELLTFDDFLKGQTLNVAENALLRVLFHANMNFAKGFNPPRNKFFVLDWIRMFSDTLVENPLLYFLVYTGVEFVGNLVSFALLNWIGKFVLHPYVPKSQINRVWRVKRSTLRIQLPIAVGIAVLCLCYESMHILLGGHAA
jgi:hypothetical protein